ncbi:MAG: KpsF/GutQ family sugar-phosphate isomerase [Alphaproteobacteria bacterium]|nr:KpsF/GutQ family sugar-phosphate isomerase [Alphaproteobacteria bacterium]
MSATSSSVVPMPASGNAEETARRNLAIARNVLETEAEALKALAAFLSDSFNDAIDAIEKATGRIIITGMGKSGHVARKIAATMASTGTPAFFVHPAEASHGDMGMITKSDVVIALSNSGESKELGDLISYARRFAIPLIGITSRPLSTLAEKSDIALLLPPCEEACPNGLAPTTSTTLTMALGDALAITLLERKGFTAKDFKTFHPGGKLGQQLMRVAEIMHKGDALPVVTPTTPVSDAVAVMSAKGFGCVAITDENGTLLGIVTDGDIRRHLAPDLLQKKAADVMTKNPIAVTPATLVAEAMGQMNNVRGASRQITALPVASDTGKLEGLLHIHDCLKAGFA